MNWTKLQQVKKKLIEAQEELRAAEIMAVKEAGDNIAWDKIKRDLGVESI